MRHGHSEHADTSGSKAFALTGATRHFERARPFRIDRMTLDLALDVPRRSVDGVAVLEFTRIDKDAKAFVLDAVGFEVADVRLNDSVVRYAYDGKSLSIPIELAVPRGVLLVSYRVTPRRGMYFLEPDEAVPARPRQVWTQCQEEDARHFFPCHDAPLVKHPFEIRVVPPNGWTVISNGDLVKKEVMTSGLTRSVFQMREPMPSYLVSVVAGEFAEWSETAEGVELQYFVPRGTEEDAKATFANTPRMLAFFNERFGVRYPYSKYAQVVVSDFTGGGMENTTATTLYEHTILDERARLDATSDELLAHELAHHWFGDWVTCREWSEGWLNEGFATYSEHLFREYDKGEDEYFHYLAHDLESYLSEANERYARAVVTRDYHAPMDLFDRHLYEKGGLFLHGLRELVGTDVFFAAVKMYLTRFARGAVETRDFLRVLEEVSGKSVAERFDAQLYRPGHPELNVEVSWDEGVLFVKIEQTQTPGEAPTRHFDVDLPIAVVDRGVTVHIVNTREAVTRVAIPQPTRPAHVVVDPRLTVLGSVRVSAPEDMLLSQLANASSARGRSLAARALVDKHSMAVVRALGASLGSSDESWCVRSVVAEALGELGGALAETALVGASEDSDPRVRRAVASALSRFRTERVRAVLSARLAHDPSYLVQAEAARSLGRVRGDGAFSALVEALGRPSWADVLAASAASGLAALSDERSRQALAEKCRYGEPTRLRRSSMMALAKVDPSPKTRRELEELLDDTDPNLRIDVARALLEVADPRAVSALSARLDRDSDPRVRRRLREVIRDLVAASPSKAASELAERISSLEQSLRDLRETVSAHTARKQAKAPRKKPSRSKKR